FGELPGHAAAIKAAMDAERWLEEGWFDAQQHFWNRFRETGELEPGARTGKSWRVPGTLGLKASLAPGEEIELPFAFSWVFPTTSKYWAGKDEPVEKWTPFYATQWPDAWSAAAEYWSRREELDRLTFAFGDALHASTLPEALVESVGATLTTLRTPTCLRLEDGTFWAWEGCSPKDGCCAGTCSHVWNYATAHAWLFPEIARSIRETEYQYAFNCGPMGKEGALDFRVPIPLKQETKLWHAASDGQLGGIIQLYRDWRITGDEETLKRLWPSAKRALEFAWVQWDRDRDGLVEGDQHNTYDINFQGPNPLTQFMYLGALKAAAEIGHRLDDPQGQVYADLYEKGRAKSESELWNGEFFVQTNDCLKEDAPKYQHGVGCLSDQLFGALCAKVAGLGDVVDPEKVKSALRSIFRNNFKDPLGDHENLQRVYVFRDEAGLLLCSWPNGGRPRFPFFYSDEVWTGIEYQVAAHLAFEGMHDEALKILEAIRVRYDGRRRNPYNEYECGSHYARALASWSVFMAFIGFRHDAVTDSATFHPWNPGGGPFECLYCTGSEWGRARHFQGQFQLEPLV
ncbi:MAG TPA: GH116 family glycosyl hydrolase, partial [Fimbriimonadaceae bacterium]|nr:GH116 family glycosyl hydrolase [Fimbriimonadaceae bacterium]